MGGSENLMLKIPAYRALPLKDVEPFTLMAEVKPEQIVLQQNSVCSKWMDVPTFVHSQDIDVHDKVDAYKIMNFDI